MNARQGVLQRSVAAQIRAELAYQNVSQAELAAGLGYSQQTVSKKLNGRLDITLNDAEKAASCLGVSVWQFLVERAA